MMDSSNGLNSMEVMADLWKSVGALNGNSRLMLLGSGVPNTNVPITARGGKHGVFSLGPLNVLDGSMVAHTEGGLIGDPLRALSLRQVDGPVTVTGQQGTGVDQWRPVQAVTFHVAVVSDRMDRLFQVLWDDVTWNSMTGSPSYSSSLSSSSSSSASSSLTKVLDNWESFNINNSLSFFLEACVPVATYIEAGKVLLSSPNWSGSTSRVKQGHGKFTVCSIS
ncbi:hypothetical protein WICPIJ_006099 [Wickerhamomyces pijperi]|uniref:Uncharacterized protein n=1 Tax=Wickerhamomyces pijperi TaxID=599730 RepID=A0A9P8Q2U9_WICPI|nr:hypothetical protein WICPIJ_006099 [Wickerhamomyces pijperi]